MLWAIIALGLAWWGGAWWHANRAVLLARAKREPVVEEDLLLYECQGCYQLFSAYPKLLDVATRLHMELACTAVDEEAA